MSYAIVFRNFKIEVLEIINYIKSVNLFLFATLYSIFCCRLRSFTLHSLLNQCHIIFLFTVNFLRQDCF
jgi:hypothetical protein